MENDVIKNSFNGSGCLHEFKIVAFCSLAFKNVYQYIIEYLCQKGVPS